MPEEQRVYLGVAAIVASQTMRQVMDLVVRAARTNATVLITGETGSGKEIVARAIHHYSLRAGRPWVDFNCAALPEHLVESELFGHEKGAFSGADSAKPGLFDLANTGTLFLDEIGELELRVQVKLLRVLDGVPYYRVGGQKKVAVDARIVAATNQNLEAAVAARRFRADLFHRLNQCPIRVPPLRERRDDIVPIAEYFLGNMGSTPGSRRRPNGRWSDTLGPATFASCATPSPKPWWPPGLTKSASPTCRPCWRRRLPGRWSAVLWSWTAWRKRPFLPRFIEPAAISRKPPICWAFRGAR